MEPQVNEDSKDKEYKPHLKKEGSGNRRGPKRGVVKEEDVRLILYLEFC